MLELHAKVNILQIATEGCEIPVIHASRVLDPVLQMSKSEK